MLSIRFRGIFPAVSPHSPCAPMPLEGCYAKSMDSRGIPRHSALKAVALQASLQACGVVFPFAISTSICRSSVTICSGLYLLIGITGFPPQMNSLTSPGTKTPVRSGCGVAKRHFLDSHESTLHQSSEEAFWERHYRDGRHFENASEKTWLARTSQAQL